MAKISKKLQIDRDLKKSLEVNGIKILIEKKKTFRNIIGICLTVARQTVLDSLMLLSGK